MAKPGSAQERAWGIGLYLSEKGNSGYAAIEDMRKELLPNLSPDERTDHGKAADIYRMMAQTKPFNH